jgi:hypothetical protein
MSLSHLLSDPELYKFTDVFCTTYANYNTMQIQMFKKSILPINLRNAAPW